MGANRRRRAVLGPALYHVNARFSTLGTALVVDGRAALVSRFSAGTFWDQVRAAGATEVGVVGAVSSILLRQEPGWADRDHNVRMMHGAAGIPMDCRADFEERFGLRLVTGFAMTETGHFSTTSPDDPMRYKASGRPVPQYEVAVVDADDNQLPPGSWASWWLAPGCRCDDDRVPPPARGHPGPHSATDGSTPAI